MKRSFRLPLLAIVSLLLILPISLRAATLSERLRGYVLLQVESHGEAWYIYPVDGRRYYLRDGAAAYNIMRRFGLGISNTDLARLQGGDQGLRQRLQGKIVLQVQAHGEAFYICPRDLSVRYIKDGAAAYSVMRTCSLGITNLNLGTIPIGVLSETPAPVPSAPTVPAPVGEPGKAMIAGCSIFPADNPWNQDVSQLPVHPRSATYIRAIGLTENLHADFGSNLDYGIPYNVVPASQPKVPITWTAYGDESDPGPYPIPSNAKREVGGDHHVLVLDSGACKLYELYKAEKNQTGSGWSAESGAIFDLRSNALRPEGWTSADAAGLPILPGLIRYEEVAAGKINHAIRFTASQTQDGWIHPATHPAGSGDASQPPMGLRVRMKANYDISRLTGQARVVAEAMKMYGMLLADNGSNWYFGGATDSRWNDDELNQLKDIPGSAFEAVQTGEVHQR